MAAVRTDERLDRQDRPGERHRRVAVRAGERAGAQVPGAGGPVLQPGGVGPALEAHADESTERPPSPIRDLRAALQRRRRSGLHAAVSRTRVTYAVDARAADAE